jgi:hypothetical protein
MIINKLFEKEDGDMNLSPYYGGAVGIQQTHLQRANIEKKQGHSNI